MNIFRIIASNLRSGPASLPFPQRVTPTSGYRGLVNLAPELCTGCGTCEYVCTPGALKVSRQPREYEWRYDPGQCTFCARCVEVCPSQALKMAPDRPPVYRQAHELLAVFHLPYPNCPECGQPAHPVNQALLERAFEEVSEEVLAWSRLCERCRGRRRHPALLNLSERGLE